MRKIESMYKLRRRAVPIDDIVEHFFLLTPVITVFLVVSFWFILGAGKS